VVEAAQGSVLAGNVELDNTGNRFTGDWRLGAGLAINDAYGLGDAWNLRAAISEGSTFVRAGYTLPLGSDGWKLGASLVESRYDLCCDASIAALDSNGKASALSTFASYPLWRTRLKNLALSATTTQRDFVNRSVGATTSDKTSRAVTLAATGDWSDMSGLGAYTSYSLQWTTGRLNLDDVAADKAADAGSAKSAGSFTKWNGQVSYLLRMSKDAALYAALFGQVATKNLDSSEKFVLGGPQGVRAYPTGEASGDEGWLLNMEWRQELSSQWRMVGFVDHGEVKLHHEPWADWNAATPGLNNRYGLSGAGISAVWAPMPGAQISTTLATRLGSNPGRDPGGRDADNRSSDTRVWLQGSVAF
jgi:hemolysin activation/secretion protein